METQSGIPRSVKESFVSFINIYHYNLLHSLTDAMKKKNCQFLHTAINTGLSSLTQIFSVISDWA